MFTFPFLGPTLVVDGMACLRSWYSCEDWVSGGQWKEYMSILVRWVEAFTSAGIRLVFFFDGVVDEHKSPEWVRIEPLLQTNNYVQCLHSHLLIEHVKGSSRSTTGEA